MEEKFTIEEFKNYVASKDSFGDVMYYLSAKNIREANIVKQCSNCDHYFDDYCSMHDKDVNKDEICGNYE